MIPDPGVSDNQGGVSVAIIPIASGPILSIVPGAGNHAIISWVPDAAGFVLQENTNAASANWTYSVTGATNPITVTASNVRKFYRLISP